MENKETSTYFTYFVAACLTAFCFRFGPTDPDEINLCDTKKETVVRGL
jgi:hypothetical protein